MSIRVFKRIFKIAGWASIAFATLLILLRFATPMLMPQIPQVSQWIQSQLPYPAQIQEIKLNWEGYSPALSLSSVDILQEDKSPALHIDKITLRLNAFQLLFKRLHLDEVVIDGAVGGIAYQQQTGQVALANLPLLAFNLNEQSSNAPFVKHIAIHNSKLNVLLDNKTSLDLSDFNLLVDIGSTLKLRAKAQIITAKSAQVEFMADIPLFGHKPKRIYCHWQGGDLDTIAQFFPAQDYHISHKDADLKVWFDIAEDNKITLASNIDLKEVEIQHAKQKVILGNIQGPLSFTKDNQQWELSSTAFELLLSEQSEQTQKEALSFSLSRKAAHEKTNWHFTGQHIDLAKWQNRLDKLNLFPQKIAALQKANIISGQLEYVNTEINIQGQNVTPVMGDFVFTDLGLTSQHYPSFKHVSLAATLSGESGKLFAQSNALTIDDANYYAKPLILNDLAFSLFWQKSKEGLVFNIANVQANVNDMPVQAQASIKFAQDKTQPDVDVMFSLGQAPLKTTLALLPYRKMDEDLTQWLDSALKAGDHLGTSGVLRGNLADFPFDKGEGVFEIITEIDNVNFNYQEGWPALTALNASLQFRNRALFISALSGNVLSGKLIDADAVIPDLFTKMPEVIVDTKIASTLAEGLYVVKNSPLPQGLVSTLAPLNFEGPMHLSLGLEIPLSSKTDAPVKVRGLIEVEEATVAYKEADFPITHLTGEVSFTQDSVKADNLSGILLATPMRFSIDSHLESGQPEVTLKAMGNIALEKMRTQFELPEINQIQGETDVVAELKISPDNADQAVLNISSSLKGIEINAPAPFAKEKEVLTALELKMYLEPNQILHMGGKYGDNVSFAYSLGMRDKNQHSLGGHIHFGEERVAKFREDQILLIDGNLAQVDFLQWKTFLATTGVFGAQTENASLPIEPMIELDIGTFTLYGAAFDKEKIEARWDTATSQWNLLFDGAMLKGQIVIPKSDTTPVTVDLQKLALTNTLADSDFTMAKTPSTQPIDIKIKDFTLGNKSFTDIKAKIEPSWKGYFFPVISAKLKDTEINMTGSWDYLSPENKISAQGKVITKNISNTLSALGLKGTVQKAKGTVDFTLNWDGSPLKIDYATLGGLADFSLKDGSIQGMNPGIGRVLSFLNLDNVKRRLNLDFSDVTKSGLAFNELSGKFQFGKGKVSSNNVILNGPSAKIEAFGQADLSNQGLDGEMIVMPNVTGSLPVAAAIAAGNPAVGAAVWMVDKMFGNKIQQIHRIRYKVDGTWASPKVDELPIPLRGKA